MVKSSAEHLSSYLGRVPRTAWIAVGVIGLLVLHAGLLRWMGQPWIYEGGYIKLWHGDVASKENSQHLTDWYTLSHIIHGVLLYALLALLFPRTPVGVRLLAAIGLEIGWELFENSDMIINRYREQALAQGYFGDSFVNSVGDVLAAMTGFLLASKLPKLGSVALVIALELIALYAIRDSLALNIIQLVHPIDAIGAWQAAR